MEEFEQGSTLGLEDYWQLMCRRRWWILGSLFIVWAIVWTISWVLPAQYRSETLILIEQQKVPQDYVESNVAADLQQRLNTIADQVLSRTRLQRIIDEFHLYPEDRDRMSPDQLVDRMRKDIEVEIELAPTGKKDVQGFHVYYSARTPQLAQQIANQLTSLFIQENLAAQQQQSESTTEFLSAELEQSRQSLAVQEDKLKAFKAQNLGQLPSQMQGNVQILTGLQSREEELTAGLHRAQQQKLYLESLLNQYRALGISTPSGKGGLGIRGESLVAGNATSAAVEQELTRLRAALDDARSRYTEMHPDVVALKAQITEAEQRKQRLEAEGMDSPGKTSEISKMTPAEVQAVSPMLQLESQLKANQQEINDIQQQIKLVEVQVRQYQDRLNMTPVREQQLADLTRDYDQSKGGYDSLLKKQIESQLATNMEKRQQGAQFYIQDPPSLPQKPFWPDRIKLGLGGVAGGLALGLGLAILLETLGNRVRTDKDIATILPSKIPTGIEILSSRVLITLPHLPDPGEEGRQRRRRRFEWAAASVLLAVVIAGNAFSIYKGHDSGLSARGNVRIGTGGSN